MEQGVVSQIIFTPSSFANVNIFLAHIAYGRYFFIERHEKHPSKSMTVRQNLVKRMHALLWSVPLGLFFAFTDQREACHFPAAGKKFLLQANLSDFSRDNVGTSLILSVSSSSW